MYLSYKFQHRHASPKQAKQFQPVSLHVQMLLYTLYHDDHTYDYRSSPMSECIMHIVLHGLRF